MANKDRPLIDMEAYQRLSATMYAEVPRITGGDKEKAVVAYQVLYHMARALNINPDVFTRASIPARKD